MKCERNGRTDRTVVYLGVEGVVLPDRPERYIGLGGKVSPFWADMFDICNATGTPLNFHLNASLDAISSIYLQYKLVAVLGGHDYATKQVLETNAARLYNLTF
jgi:hypothetical protein